RIIDLTQSAARKLDMIPYGVVPVRIRVLDVLDFLPLTDSLLHDDEIWDCFGNQRQLSGHSVYIWSTSDLKHAFYMASALSVDYGLDSVLVRVTGNAESRLYRLYATSIPAKKEAESLAAVFRRDGFRMSKLYSENHSAKANPLSGRSAK